MSAFVAMAAMLLSQTARAQTYYWTGGVGGGYASWQQGDNWSSVDQTYQQNANYPPATASSAVVIDSTCNSGTGVGKSTGGVLYLLGGHTLSSLTFGNINAQMPSTLILDQGNTSSSNQILTGTGTSDLIALTNQVVSTVDIRGYSSSSPSFVVTVVLGSSGNFNVGNSLGTLQIDCPVTNNSAGSFGFNKTGAGLLILNGSNTYAGQTTVSAGTLQANTTGTGNSATGSGAVVVNKGATLAGGTTAAPGRISGSVTINSGGTITAGTGGTLSDTVGTLTTGSQNWNGGTYTAKVTGNAASSDQLIMSGLSISMSTGPFVVSLTGIGSSPTLLSSTPIVLATVTNSTDAGVFTNAINAGALKLSTSNIITLSGQPVKLVEFDPNSGGEELLAEDSGTTASPEPASFVLLGAVMTPLLLARPTHREKGA